MDHSDKERKRHDFAFEQLHRAKDKWNKDRMKRLVFINDRLRQRIEAIGYINNDEEAMVEYYQVVMKQIKILAPELQSSDFYGPSEGQKNSELLHVTIGADLATSTLYNYDK